MKNDLKKIYKMEDDLKKMKMEDDLKKIKWKATSILRQSY